MSSRNHRSDYSAEVDDMMTTPFPDNKPSPQKETSSRELKEDTNSVFRLPSRSENEITHTAHNSGLMISEQQSLIKAVDELCNRPRKGKMYGYTDVHREELMKRLKFLSEKIGKFSIEEAIEICDASVLLKFVEQYMDENANIDHDHFKVFKTYQESVNLAGQMANNGVLLILQAKILGKKGRELLDLSKSKLREANN